MLEDMSKDALFYNYYAQWIEVYKKDAIREATMAKYRMTQKWVEKLAPELKVCELTRTAYQKILNDYAKEHERQTTLDFHHQLKSAVMDAVDEGLIERDPTRKAMFDTKFDISQITSYNSNLNKRLSRKDPKYKSRNEQLDLVIVVDRLLTGFDAPCMSTIFIDRQPMGPHDLIQAFSRTNRIFDKKSKPYGQIVTFQAPVLFKKCVDDAVKLYSAGSTEDTPLIAEWDDVEPAFKKALAALRIAAQTPDDIPSMSDDEKLHFMKMFQSFDRLFAQLKSFSRYDESMLDDYGITEQEYIDYAGHYLNIKSELGPDPGPDTVNPPVEPEIDPDYELMAYSNTRIDYEYIINLIQNIVNPEEDGDITPEEKQKKIDEAKQYVEDLRKDNPKVADIMSHLINEIELDENRFKGKSILNIVENMKHECIEQVVSNFCLLWHADKDDVMYAATHYRNGVIPNESAIKASINYPEYKNTVEHALPKFKYYAKFFAELRSTLDDEIKPLV